MADYLYKDLPLKFNGGKSFENLQVGDTLEVRLVELECDFIFFWGKLNSVKCNKIELQLKPVNDAYGMTQVFIFL
ncbi:hypothetical protein LV89_03827 [Arcicella aurantiaca]|uniref:Uncharacterized protein n=1 Tax=Arcicella aurantiaca TaxID=591202 RepID=A0A316DQL7_9BACT|nr:hypothetical protein [Arcicella aurantiaca]PWK20284.1 hypothetical protein LV89_03827 [Arcicella aurantiaca]